MSDRCIHRHTQKEHPGCFKKVIVNNKTILTVEHKGQSTWYKDQKICFFDIETTGIDGADVDFMITWAIRSLEGNTVSDSVSKDELFKLDFDRRIVESCITELKKYDVIVGYYSKRFDIPFLRTRSMKWDLPFFWYDDKHTIDLYDTVRHKLDLTRNSLAVSTEFLGIEGKTPLKRETWLKARYGDPESLGYVLEHNIADVEVTHRLFTKLDMIRRIPKSSV